MEACSRAGWAAEEFVAVDLGDQRLKTRLMGLCESFCESPESPINQACADWAQTKAAYRFFQNENVAAHEIMAAHCQKSAQRARGHHTVLAIQDTSYFVYTTHFRTQGLGRLSVKQGRTSDTISCNGLVMHACLGVTTEGLPIGLLDQRIYARQPLGQDHHKVPIEQKDSFRWLQSLKNTNEIASPTQIVTVCDREADFYHFFKFSEEIQSPVLVRANVNRSINSPSRRPDKNATKLWDFMRRQPAAGSITVEVPLHRKQRPGQERKTRIATISIKYGSFRLNPPQNDIGHRSGPLPPLPMHAIYARETNPPKEVEPLEWMLLTNLAVSNFEQACEKIRWYCLRWRIEMYFKVLKSGFLVENCRLANAQRLIRYLTLMSIVAWRLLTITLLARTSPDTPCTQLLTSQEWKILFLKVHKNQPLPETIPTISQAVIWIARLGGFLARHADGMPGTMTLWRGWKRLADLIEGWNLTNKGRSCG